MEAVVFNKCVKVTVIHKQESDKNKQKPEQHHYKHKSGWYTYQQCTSLIGLIEYLLTSNLPDR